MNRTAFFYALLTIFFWSTVATAFKLSLEHIVFLPLVFYSALVSMLVLGSLCALTGRLGQLKKWQRQDYLKSALLGALNPALYYVILFRAYELLPAQEAQVLNFMWPVVLTLMGAYFLKQHLSGLSILAIAVSFIGVVIIATHGNVFSMQFSNPLGVSLALVSTVVWASYWLISQTDQQDSLLRLWVNFIAGVVWMALLMSFTHSWVMPPTSALMGAAYIGLFEMSLAFYCWFQALRLSDNIGLMNNLIFLTPFGSLMVIALVLKEPIHVSTVLGLGLICASILIQRYLAARVAAREKAHHDII